MVNDLCLNTEIRMKSIFQEKGKLIRRFAYRRGVGLIHGAIRVFDLLPRIVKLNLCFCAGQRLIIIAHHMAFFPYFIHKRLG